MTQDWFDQIPKIELHVHLEGAIPYDALWELVQKYNGDKQVPNKEALLRRFEFRDFAHFIDIWMWKNQFLREYEDFKFIAEAMAREFSRQNIRYAEVFFSPPDFARFGLEVQRITEAVHDGLKKVDGIDVSLVADLVRDFGPKEGNITLSEINEVRHLGVVGVGIGGSEQKFPPEAFKAVFERARHLGFHTSAHAGEAAGAESMWGAIRHLKVERIGHGTRAEEDESLLAYLVESRTPLEVCPVSNVKTGVVDSYDAHPVRRYFDLGIPLSINTDDPMMFGNTLADEYRLLVEKKRFTKKEIQELVLGAIEMSWMPEERKREMITQFAENPAWFGRQNG